MKRAWPLVLMLVCLMSPVANAQGRLPRDLNGLAEFGTAALKEGRFGDALDAFTEAAKLAPRDASICLVAGYSAFRLGKLADAETWLERALALNPRMLDASILLGQVLYRAGKVAEAVSVYEAALKYSPDDQALITALGTWRKDSQINSQLYETRGSHFSVRFDGPTDDTNARRIVEMLEQVYWEIGRVLSTYPTNAVTVVLYTRQQFQDTTRIANWASGAYDGRIKLPIGGALPPPDELNRLLRHEFVHAVVASLAGSAAPVWVNEGLATALETGSVDWAERLLARDSRRVPLTRLESSFNAMSSDQANIAYALSAVAVKKMIDLRGAPAVVSLLQALGRGTPFEYAFQQAIAMRYEDFATMIGRE